MFAVCYVVLATALWHCSPMMDPVEALGLSTLENTKVPYHVGNRFSPTIVWNFEGGVPFPGRIIEGGPNAQ